MNSTTCEEKCNTIDGHLPCLYDVDSVLTQLFENKTINATVYPIFREMKTISSGNDIEFTFHTRARYNFQTEIWKSCGFEIKKQQWAETNEREPKYPLLNDRLLLIRNQWPTEDHFGAVYCGDELEERQFKVRLLVSYLWTHLEIFSSR